MLSKNFVQICLNSINESIREMGLPLNKILEEMNHLFEQELKNKNFTNNLTKQGVFDLYSYSVFKIVSKYLKGNEERLKFTQLIGKKIYSWIKRKKNLEINGADDIPKIKHTLKQIMKFFEENGYVSKAKIKWEFFNEEVWKKEGESYFIYVMENPVILLSAQRLYLEENFGQHYSTRTLEAALLDFSIEGREIESFDPTKFDNHIEELWKLNKI